jgi:hypothetical protein
MAATLTLVPKPLNFSKDPMWVEFESSLISGIGDPDEPNLSLYAQIWIKRNASDIFLTEVNLTYSRITAKTDMDLSNITDCEPEPPTDASIDAFGFGVVYKPACELQVKYEDMYGDPVEFPSTLNNSAFYWVIYGGTPYYFGNGDGAPSQFWLHSFFDKKGKSVIRQTRKSQPEYLYIFSPGSASWTLKCDLIYTDGTLTSHTVNTVNLQTGVNWVTVGWDQMNMSANINAAKTLAMYNVYFDQMPMGKLKYISFQLDDHDTEYDEYILFDNGIGGCEIVRCSGRHQEDFESQKTIISKPRVRGFTSRDGLTGHTNASGASLWKMNTGWISDAFARHLRQLTLADVWYVDRKRGKFEKVTVKENSLKLVDRNEDLHSLEFSIQFDSREAANNFRI